MEPPEARDTPPGLAGAMLRAARESAGMTVDAVAQNLKLAPRQVKAIEDGDYEELPGRTFIRGFVRNYARLVRLDPERVLSALPGGSSAPALEAPLLSPTAPTIGELPTTEHARTPWARWVIPSVLAAIVAIAAIYEWMRPPGESHLAVPAAEPHGAGQKGPGASAPVPSTVDAAAVPATALPNPVAANAPGSDAVHSAPSDFSRATASVKSGGGATPAAADERPPTTAAVSGTAPTSAPAATPAPAATSAAATTPGAATTMPGAAAAAAPVSEQTVVVAFRDNSWAEIRDRNGQVLLSGIYHRGTAQTVTGAPPLSIKIGNAGDVTVRYKGERVDLAPYTQKNVARLTLP